MSAEAAVQLGAALDRAVASASHVLLNLSSCSYLSPEALEAISEASPRFLDAGLELTPIAATGIVRPLVNSALASPP